MGAHFTGVKVFFLSFEANSRVRVAVGSKLPQRRTGKAKMTGIMPWDPVVIDLALSALHGDNDLLTSGSKSIRERPRNDFKTSLRDSLLKTSSGDEELLSSK